MFSMVQDDSFDGHPFCKWLPNVRPGFMSSIACGQSWQHQQHAECTEPAILARSLVSEGYGTQSRPGFEKKPGKLGRGCKGHVTDSQRC